MRRVDLVTVHPEETLEAIIPKLRIHSGLAVVDVNDTVVGVISRCEAEHIHPSLDALQQF